MKLRRFRWHYRQGNRRFRWHYRQRNRTVCLRTVRHWREAGRNCHPVAAWFSLPPGLVEPAGFHCTSPGGYQRMLPREGCHSHQLPVAERNGVAVVLGVSSEAITASSSAAVRADILGAQVRQDPQEAVGEIPARWGIGRTVAGQVLVTGNGLT